MKIRLLKKLRKKSSKKVYIRPPRASWDYYAIITPEKLIFIFLAKKILIIQENFLQKREENLFCEKQNLLEVFNIKKEIPHVYLKN